MNILLINYEYPPIGGGAGNATACTGRALAAQGHLVTVLTCAYGDISSDPPLANPRVLRLRCRRASASHASTLEMADFVWRAWRYLPGLIEECAIEAIIVYFTIPCGPLARWAYGRRKVPYVVSLRGGDVPGLVPELGLAHFLLTPFRRAVLAGARAIVANAEGLAQLSEKADPHKVRVIPNGVDISTYTPSTDPRTGPLRFLFIGRFQEQKNLAHMLSQFARLPASADWRLDIVGDGPLATGLRSHADTLGISGRITWHGWLSKDKLPSIYHQAEVLINPSHYEGLPNVVLEAMASGLPVIASAIPGHVELIRHGVNGFMFNHAEPDGLLGQLSSALSTERTQLRALGLAGRAQVEREHSWDVIARRYVELF